MNDPEMTRRVLDARRALGEERLDDAQRLFDQVLEQRPDHIAARDGLQMVQARRALGRQVRELQQQGDGLFAQADYAGARKCYVEALNLGGEQGFISLHNELEGRLRLTSDLLHRRDQIERIAASVQRMQQRGADENTQSLLTQIGNLLEDLPQRAEYDPMREFLRQERQKLEALVGDEENLTNARAAYKRYDFEQAARLADRIPAEAPTYRQAMKVKEQALERMQRIQPILDAADAAVAAERWADAFAHLHQLRQSIPDNPSWQRSWMRVGMAHGDTLLEQGRNAVQQRRFPVAQQQFQEARDALANVIEVYPEHSEARKRHQEATDLMEIAQILAQATIDWGAGNYTLALRALQTALEVIARAEAEARAYTAVKTVVTTTMATIAGEKQARDDEAAAMEAGRNALERRSLTRAQACFQQVLQNPQSVENEQLARQLLEQVDAELQTFHQLLDQAAAAPLEVQVDSYQQAYDRFPDGTTSDGQPVSTALEQVLVAQGYAQLPQAEEQALRLFDRALQLNPDNRRAEQGKRMPEMTTRVTGELQIVAEELRNLPEAPTPDAFAAPLERLQTLATEIADFPDLSAQIRQQIQDITSQQQHWQTYTDHRQQAQTQIEQGDWQTAISTLTTVLQAGASPLAADQQCLEAWQALADRIEQVRAQVQALWQEVQAALTTPAPALPDLSALGDRLEQIITLLRQLDTDARQHDGQLPPDLATLVQAATRTRTYVRLVSRIDATLQTADATAETLHRAIREIQTFRQEEEEQQAYALLDRFEADLQQRLRDQIPRLLDRARRQLVQEADGAAAAEQTIAPLVRLQTVAVAEIQALQQEIERYRAFHQRLKHLETEIAAQRTDQRLGRVEAGLRTWLQEALDFPELAGVDSSRWKQSLHELLEFRRADESYYGHPDNWETITSHLDALGQQRQVSRLAHETAAQAREWAVVARDVTQQGLASTMAEMGEYLQAVRIARDYYLNHRDDTAAKANLDQLTEKVVQDAHKKARRRLADASRALNSGHDEDAAAALQSIDAEIYQELITHGLKQQLEDDPERDQIRNEVQSLQTRIDTYRRVKQEAGPILDLAIKQFDERDQDTDLDRIEQQLLSLPRIDDFPALVSRREDLQTRLHAYRAYKVQQDLDDLLAAVRVVLEYTPGEAALKQASNDLKAFMQRRDWEILSPDQQDKFREVSKSVAARQQQVLDIRLLEQELADARTAGNYAEMKRTLDALVEQTVDLEQRNIWQIERRKIERRAKDQQEIEQTLADGVQRLNDDDFAAARQEFSRAESLGGNVADYLVVVRAGLIYHNVKNTWTDETSLDNALAELRKAEKLLKPADAPAATSDADADGSIATPTPATTKARELREDITDLRQRITQQQAKLTQKLDQAGESLQAGNIDAAEQEVEQVLATYKNYADAQALQEIITKRRQQQAVARMLADAEKLKQEQNYQGALKSVESVRQQFPDNLEARSLEAELHELLKHQADAEAARERVHTALDRARQHAKNFEFAAAYEAIEDAEQNNINSTKIKETRDFILEQEAEYGKRVTAPIRNALKRKQFNLALQSAGEALQKELRYPADLSREVETLQQTTITDWITHESQKTSDVLAQGQVAIGLKHLQGLATVYQELHAISSTLTILPQAQLQKLVDQRLMLAQSLFDALSAQPAEAVGDLQQLEPLAGTIRDDADTLDSIGTAFWQAQELHEQIQEAVITCQAQAMRQQYDAVMVNVTTQAPDITLAGVEQIVTQLRTTITRIEQSPDHIRAAGEQDGTNVLETLRNIYEMVLPIKEALERSDKLLEQQSFLQAQYALPAEVDIPFLQPLYTRQQQLLKTILEAQQLATSGEWRQAYERYQEVVRQRPTLGQTLRPDLDSCRRHLTDKVLRDVWSALEKAPPDVQQAQTLMQTAETERWWSEDKVDEIRQLQQKLPVFERLAAAASRILHTEDESAMHAALDDLAHIRQIPDAPAQTTSWQQLAQAVLARNRQDAAHAERLLAAVAPPVAELPLAQQIYLWVDIKRQVDMLAQTLTSELRPILERLQQAIQQTPHPSFEKLRQSLQTHLAETFTAACQEGYFAEAREQGTLLLALPIDADLRAQINGLPEERTQIIEQRIEQIREALVAYDVQTADQHLTFALRVAAPEGDSRLSELQQQVNERQQAVEEATALLQQYTDVIGQWAEHTNGMTAEAIPVEQLTTLPGQDTTCRIVDTLLQARQRAGDYLPVEQAIQDLQQDWSTRIQTYIDQKLFPWALALCEQALRLNETEELQRLKTVTMEQCAAQVEQLEQVTERLLHCWNITAAHEHIQRMQAIGAPPDKVDHLASQMQQLVDQSDPVQAQMEQGLALWLQADYSQARAIFAQIATRTEPFPEACFWQDYMDNLITGIHAVEKDEFSQAYTVLTTARNALAIQDSTTLPSIVQSVAYIAEQRRRAVYNVQQLLEILQSIRDLDEAARRHEQNKEFDKAEATINSMLEQKKTLLAASRSVRPVPEDFVMQTAVIQAHQEHEL